jgi:hypothetical protein
MSELSPDLFIKRLKSNDDCEKPGRNETQKTIKSNDRLMEVKIYVNV